MPHLEKLNKVSMQPPFPKPTMIIYSYHHRNIHWLIPGQVVMVLSKLHHKMALAINTELFMLQSVKS